MGNYASTTDLTARFESDADVAHLTDTADSGSPDTDVLNEVIDHAEGQVDSYVTRRYLVPVAVADHTGLAAMMKSVTLDLAQFHLYARGHQQSEPTTALHDKAIEWLRDVSKGVVILPSPDTEPATASREPDAAFGTAGTGDDTSRIFSRDTQNAL